MKTIKVYFHVSMDFHGCEKSETITLLVKENATEREIEEVVQDEYEEWLYQNVNTHWSIKEQ